VNVDIVQSRVLLSQPAIDAIGSVEKPQLPCVFRNDYRAARVHAVRSEVPSMQLPERPSGPLFSSRVDLMALDV
jgi:hypothetical protein